MADNQGIFRKKDLAELIPDTRHVGGGLKRSLGAFDLTLLGIGAIIGTGIFVLTGIVAAQHSGPAIIISFIISGMACAFAALCYAEFASMVPVAGSVYTYSYFALGEFIAWMIGWILILEYMLASSAVASGWSGYFVSLVEGLGISIPDAFHSAPGTTSGAIADLPAFFIVIIITWLLSLGVKESAKINNIMVIVKLTVVLLFMLVGVFYVKPENWVPFMPFGIEGIMTGAATVFFAYIGFDAVSTAAEEVKNPQRNMPVGILSSLFVCTLLYVLVSGVLTGIVDYTQLNVKDPVAFGIQYIGQDWLAGLISLGAIAGITTVMLVMMFGQIRIFYAMSKDGLIPNIFSRVHPHRRTPFAGTWIVGIIVSLIATFIPLAQLAHLVNMGTLTAFSLVSIAVIVLRRTRPDVPRAFKVPAVPLIPVLAVLFCGYLMYFLPAVTWYAFLIWASLGIIIYFLYGYRNSLKAAKNNQ